MQQQQQQQQPAHDMDNNGGISCTSAAGRSSNAAAAANNENGSSHQTMTSHRQLPPHFNNSSSSSHVIAGIILDEEAEEESEDHDDAVFVDSRSNTGHGCRVLHDEDRESARQRQEFADQENEEEGDEGDDEDEDEDSEEIFGLRSHQRQMQNSAAAASSFQASNASSQPLVHDRTSRITSSHSHPNRESNLISNPFQLHHDHHHLLSHKNIPSANALLATSLPEVQQYPPPDPNTAAGNSVTVSHKPCSNSSSKQVMTSHIVSSNSADVPTPLDNSGNSASAATIDCSSLTQVMQLAAGLVHASSSPTPSSSNTSMTMTRSKSEYHCSNSSASGNKHPVLSRGSLGSSAAAASVASATTPSPSHPLIQVIRDTVYSSFLYNKQRMQERLLPLLPITGTATSSNNSKSAPTTPTTNSSPSSSTSTMFLLKTSDPVMESKIRSLKSARVHLKQLLRITAGPVMTSLNQLNHSFANLDTIVKELNGNRVAAFGSNSSVLLSSGNVSSSSSNSSLDQQIREVAASFRLIAAEADKMRTGVAFFNANLQTLVNKSMADTMRTCDQLECSRIEFDAERNHLLSLQTSSTGTSAETQYLNQRREKVMQLETAYLNLKKDVCVKMDFLSSNRDKVLFKSLSLMHSLLHGFFQVLPAASSQQKCHPSTGQVLSKLDSVLKAYSILSRKGGGSGSSSSTGGLPEESVVNLNQSSSNQYMPHHHHGNSNSITGISQSKS